MRSLTQCLSHLAHGSCFILVSAAALYPSKVSRAAPDVYEFTVANKLALSNDQADIARGIERSLKSHGFSDNLIIGAIVNAYAESRLNPAAVGSAGELGIFQINPQGLGKKMKPHEMKDARTSVDKIAEAVKKSKKIMSLEKKAASAAEHTIAFCTEIERPKDKFRKAKQRVKIMKEIMKKNY